MTKYHHLILVCLGMLVESCGPTETRIGQRVQGQDVTGDMAASMPDAATDMSVAVPMTTRVLPARTACTDASQVCSGPAPELRIDVDSGVAYRIRVSGTYTGGSSHGGCTDVFADARYHACSNQADADPWQDAADPNDYVGPQHFDVQLWNGTRFVTPQWDEAYNAAHVYTMLWRAGDSVLRLQINDPDAGDNFGELQVEVTPETCGAIGQACCPGQSCLAPGSTCDTSHGCVPCGGPGEPACIEGCRTVSVPATRTASTPLQPRLLPVGAGQTYLLRASGTYNVGDTALADARYLRQESGAWTTQGAASLQLWDEARNEYVSPDWGAYNASHRYGLLWTAQSDTLRVQLSDSEIGDSRGSLALEVCPSSCGLAGQACCFGSVCASGATCDAAGQCIACGQPETPACPEPAACRTQMIDSRRFPESGDSCPPELEVPVTAGKTYRISVDGTYQSRGDSIQIVADAQYNSVDGAPWTDPENAGNSDEGAPFLDLQVRNGSGPAMFSSPFWGALNEDHRYSTLWRAARDTLCFRTFDDSPGDNLGSLRVQVCEVGCGMPGQPCCADGGCQVGHSCDISNRCMACGGPGQPMCCGQTTFAAGQGPVTIPVSPNVDYRLTARGRYVVMSSGNYAVEADAMCVLDGRENTPAWSTSFRSNPAEVLDLQVGTATGYTSMFAPQAVCDPIAHSYSFPWRAPADGNLRLRVNDTDPRVNLRSTSTGGLTVSYCIANVAACDDGNPCTIDQVVDGQCRHLDPAPAGTLCRPVAGACDTAEYCTGTSTICPTDAYVATGTVCRPVTGTCDVQEVCSGSSPTCPSDQYQLDTVCNSGYRCTGQGSACPQSCTVDANCATGYFCVAGQCVPLKPNGQTCASNDQCQSRMCIDGYCCNGACGGQCDRCNVPGSLGVCTLVTGDSCNDGNACTSNDSCQAGTCGGTPKVCTDNNACTSDSCNPSTGQCGFTTISCDDGNSCTRDDCNPSSGCSHSSVPDGTPCSDGNACNGVGSCWVNECRPPAETCNGRDDDCDGQIDEDGVCFVKADGQDGRSGRVKHDACTAVKWSWNLPSSVAYGTTISANSSAPGPGRQCGSEPPFRWPAENPAVPSQFLPFPESPLPIPYFDWANGSVSGTDVPGSLATCGRAGCVQEFCLYTQPGKRYCVTVEHICHNDGIPLPETCNGMDDDCNGQIDDGLPRTIFYRDEDGDGYGNGGISIQACAAPAGYVAQASDCNDSNSAIRPGAAEVCNGVDDNCNGQTDEGDPGGGASCATGQPSVCASGTMHCQGGQLMCAPDTGPTSETCNGIDDDCNGQVDEGDACYPRVDVSGITYTPLGGPWSVTVACSGNPPTSMVGWQTWRNCDDSRWNGTGDWTRPCGWHVEGTMTGTLAEATGCYHDLCIRVCDGPNLTGHCHEDCHTQIFGR